MDEDMFSGVRGEVAGLRDELDLLTSGAEKASRTIETGLLRAVRTGKLGFGLDAARAIHAIDGKAEAPSVKQRAPIEMVAAQLSVRHHDAARDYQIGVQTARRPGPGARSEEIDLPAMVSADEARRLADRKMRAALRRRTTIRRSAGWAALELAVGDVVTLSDEPGRWLVEACDWDDMAVRLSLRAFEAGTRALGASGESGVVVSQPDRVQGATSLALIELPGDGASVAVAPLVYAAATGADAGWRRAALFRYRPELESAEALGVTAARAVLGIADTVLADGAAWRMDLRSSVEVVLDHAGDALVSLADDLLIDGANLCQIGDELLQFGQAEPVGAGRYRLSRLIRGRLGTEWACAAHGAGERFALIDAARLLPLSVAPADVGTTFTLRAVGSGDAVPAEVTHMIHGRAMMPPSPVHGRIERSGAGDRTISWVRRSRLGWGWADMADVPLGEEREGYAISILADGSVLRAWESAVPLTTYVAEALADDLAAAGAHPLNIEIRQSGTWGLSPPLILPMT